MKRFIVILILMFVLSGSFTHAAWSSWGKMSYYRNVTTYGIDYNVPNVTKTGTVASVTFEGKNATSSTTPVAFQVNSNKEARSSEVGLRNKTVSATSWATQNYIYNMALRGSSWQVNWDTQDVRHNPN